MPKGSTVAKKLSTEKKPRGRPRKPIDLVQLKEQLSEGLTKEEAYAKQDLTPQHGIVREKQDPQLSSVIKEGPEEFRSKFAAAVKPKIVKAYWEKINEGDIAAILYGMKAIVGFREASRLEVSGEVSHVHSLSPEDRAKRITELKRELESAVDVQLIEESKDDPT